MGKYFVPFSASTPADRVRQAVDLAEKRVIGVRGAGHRALDVLHLLDQAAQGLKELDAAGADVRAETVRFETVLRQVRRRQKRFVSEVGEALQEERASVQPDQERWWWFLDEAVAQQRRHRLRRAVVGTLVAALVLALAWVVYDRFLAPPRNVREAFQHGATGESLAEQGDLTAALREFEAAVALDPTDPEYWVWKGVVHTGLDEVDEAGAAFDTARAMYETDLGFLIERGMAYLRVGDLERASADAEQAIARYPSEAGWAFTLRANIALERGDYLAAISDLDRAGEVAAAAGDTQLEAYSRIQRAMVMQLQAGQMPMP